MMADVQEAAITDIAEWMSTMRNVQMEHRPSSMQERIAVELTRIRYEMTAIRELLESRKYHVNAGEF
jgi:hypothetical protein